MPFKTRTSAIVSALAGIVAILVFLWLFASTKLTSHLRSSVAQEEIAVKAEAFFKSTSLAEIPNRREVRLRVDDGLYGYVQTHAVKLLPSTPLPVAKWNYRWRGEIVQNGEKHKTSVTAKYDLSGNPVYYEIDQPRFNLQPSLTLPEARQTAQRYLLMHGIDTAIVHLQFKKVQEKDSTRYYEFTSEIPLLPSRELKQSYLVELAGPEVIRYEYDVKVDDQLVKTGKPEKISDIVAIVLAALIWIAAGILVIAGFIKRLRHDEIEFRTGLKLGLFSFVLMWLMIAVNSWPEWQGIVFGGGLGGLFVGIGIVICYATAEALNREIWPEKLQLVDLVFRGVMRVKEMGLAFLRSFWVTGATLLLLSVLILVAGNSGVGYLQVDDDSLWAFGDLERVFSALASNFVGAEFVGILIVLFWSAWLKSRIANEKWLIPLISLSFLFTFLQFIGLKPAYLAIPIFLPLALLWGYFIYKHDFFTIFLSLVGFYFFKDFAFAGLTPDGFTGHLGIATAELGLAWLLIGVLLSFSKATASEFKNYVPEYVSRIAERERLLKELEIARSVQMQFLPAKVPKFPGLEIACICQPAMEVGGDYYDFVVKGNDALNVLIGDVSGKGVSAAFYMTMTKGILKTLSRRIDSPKVLLAELNEIFYENTPKEVFISAIYGQFDMQQRQLSFSRAGHNPLIVRKSVGVAPELLNPRGLAVGLESGRIFRATIEEMAVPIELGDVFLFYTDGISEAMNKNGDEFGENRLQTIVSENAAGSAQEILEMITAEVSTFSDDAKQHDDITMVVIKVTS